MHDDRPRHDAERGHEDREHRRKHVALWTAVGGTMALIVTLWALLLPTQFELGQSAASRDASRWGVASTPDGKSRSFHEALDEIGTRLEDIEIEQRKQLRAQQPLPSSPVVSGEIEALRARIEAASKKNEVPPSGPGADAETP